MPPAQYQRVAAEIRRRVEAGDWPPGTQIPSQAQLAEQLRVTLAEARRGMTVLRREGILEGSPRSRLFVAHPPAVRTLLNPDADWQYPTGDGATGSCLATSDLAGRLEVVLRTQLSWELVECLDPDQRPSHLITTWWAGARRGAWERSTASARMHRLTAGEAERLGLISGVPAWQVIRTRYAAGRPVETADLILPADRWELRLA